MVRLVILILALGITYTVAAQTNGGEGKKLVPVISKKGNTEFSPTISADGRTLIFETQNGKKWELYQSSQNANGDWSEPVPLTAINNKCQFIAGPSLSYDGNTLYYTAFIEEVTKSEDIFYSVRLNENEWSEPKAIGSPINTDDEYEGFPSIASDGNALYFIRVNNENGFDKKSKEACFVIYVSHKEENGSWGPPQPISPTVNQGCERDPRIMADNHTLIFSSIRPEGKGKYDLYQTRLQGDGSWSTPVPLNFVNSPENDQAPCISASGNKMFYYSNEDIYEITIPQEYRQMINVTVHGTVLAGKDKLPVKATISVNAIGGGEAFVSESNGSDGRYSIVLAAGRSYEIVFSHPDFLQEKLSLDYTNQQTYLEKIVNVTLADSFIFLLSVQDKDLKKPVSTFVKVSDRNGASIFADSVRANSYPKSLTLQTKNAYQMSISAPGYNSITKAIAVNADTRSETSDLEFIEYEKVSVAADVTDVTTGDKKRLKVTYKNETTGEVIIADAGEVVNLRKGDRYQVTTNSDKGLSYSIKTITAGEGSTTEKNTYTVSLPVVGLREGAKLTLNYIYFETDSWELSEASAMELNNIVQLLQRNPNVTIEISAHTDNVGADDYNFNLSQKRALSVTTYLNKKGIPLKQLVAKGYGKTKHIASNDTEEDKAKNRRVELLVLKVN